MSLFADGEEFSVTIYYKRNGKKLEVLDPSTIKEDAPEISNYKKETFVFRKPAWKEMKNILSESVTLTPESGWKIDPWKFMDSKIKHLLKNWTLKEDETKENSTKVPISKASIDRLEPEIVSYLNAKIDEKFGDVSSLI